MITEYRTLQTQRYPIEFKYYLPDDGQSRGVCLGVHGFCGDKESSALRLLAQSLTDKGRALVCFDFPCHGASPAQENRFTVANCAADLLAAAERVRAEFPGAERYLFATSFGGFMALLCAGSLRDFRTVLRAPAVTMPEHILTDVLGVTPEQLRERGEILCGFDRKILLPYRFYEELQACSILDRSFPEPMLVIHGDADDVVPPEDIRRFCETRPGMLLQVVPGADHRFKNPGELERVVALAERFWKI